MKKFLGGIASFLVALLFAEAVSRLIITIAADSSPKDTSREEPIIISQTLGWELEPNFNAEFRGYHREFDENGWIAGDRQKLRDTTHKKILFIGDSKTFGNDSPADKIFVAVVDSLLPDAVTINGGVLGYTSYQGKIRLLHMLREFRPDAIVVSFSYNDRRYVVPPDLPDGEEAFEKMYALSIRKKITERLEYIYMFRVVRAALRHLGVIKEEQIRAMDVDSLPPRVSPSDYRKNMRQMAQMAKERHIPFWFLSLDDSPTQTHFLRRGIDVLLHGQPDSAIEQLRIQARQSTAFTSLARRLLSRAYLQKGMSAEAAAARIIKRPQRSASGGHPIYLDSEYNDIMREVAQEEGVEVIDGAAALMNRQSVYYDFCHFDTTGHRMVAEVIVNRMKSSLGRITTE